MYASLCERNKEEKVKEREKGRGKYARKRRAALKNKSAE